MRLKEREIEEESQLLLTNNANNNNNSNGNNSDTNNNSESLLSMKELKENDFPLIEIDSEFQVKKCKSLLDYKQKLNDFKEKQEYDLEYYLC